MPRVAIGLAIAFALVIVVFHFLRPDVDPLMRGVSRYAVGRYGQAFNAASLILGVALVATGFGFRRIAPDSGTVGVYLLWLSAAGIALAGAFPLRAVDSMAAENLPPQAGGVLFFPAAAAAAVLLSRATGRHEALAWATVAAVTVFFLSVGVPALQLTAVRGLLQRACFVAILSWLVLANAAVDQEWRRATFGSTPAARLEGT
jgi:hypothetical membrane protein